jgi:RecB family endonuclease NucS
MDEASQLRSVPHVALATDGDLAKALLAALDALFDGRVNQKVDLGRGPVGFEAFDSAGNLTLIRVKAGTADADTIADVLDRLRRYREHRGPQVRALFIAKDFTQGAIDAAQAGHGLEIQSYEVALLLSPARMATSEATGAQAER